MHTALANGATTVDKLLGNAFQIVKHVQENLSAIIALAPLATELQQVVDNLNGVESTLQATLLANGGAEMIGTSEDGISVQDALAARPKLALLAGLTGAAQIGTSEEGTNVQEALDLKASVAALDALTASLATHVPVFATEAQLGDITHAANTTGKFAGKLAFNSTDNKLYIAQGAANVSIWRSADGTSQIDPVLT